MPAVFTIEYDAIPIEGIVRLGNTYRLGGGTSALKEGHVGYAYELIDDDGLVNYRGWVWFSDPDDNDDEVYDLYTFGMADAGTTVLRFPNHPEWDIG